MEFTDGRRTREDVRGHLQLGQLLVAFIREGPNDCHELFMQEGMEAHVCDVPVVHPAIPEKKYCGDGSQIQAKPLPAQGRRVPFIGDHVFCHHVIKPVLYCQGVEQLNSAFDTLAIEDGLDYVVAEHVITDEGDTSALGWQRFGLNLTSVPTIFLFRDGGMYHWDITDMGLHTLLHEELVAVIRTFANEGYKELPKLQVPPDIFAGAPPVSEFLIYLRKMRRLVAEVLEDKMGDSDPKYLIACGLAILVVGNILNRTAKKAAKKQKAAARKKD